MQVSLKSYRVLVTRKSFLILPVMWREFKVRSFQITKLIRKGWKNWRNGIRIGRQDGWWMRQKLTHQMSLPNHMRARSNLSPILLLDYLMHRREEEETKPRRRGVGNLLHRHRATDLWQCNSRHHTWAAAVYSIIKIDHDSRNNLRKLYEQPTLHRGPPSMHNQWLANTFDAFSLSEYIDHKTPKTTGSYSCCSWFFFGHERANETSSEAPWIVYRSQHGKVAQGKHRKGSAIWFTRGSERRMVVVQGPQLRVHQ